MKRFASVPYLILTTLTGQLSAAADSNLLSLVPGNYLHVAESEWSMTLNLDSDGSANYVITTWEAGKRSSTSKRESIAGNWRSDARNIIVSFGGENAGKSVTYRVEACLSYESIGRKECSFGLEPISSSMPRHFSFPLWNAQAFQIKGMR